MKRIRIMLFGLLLLLAACTGGTPTTTQPTAESPPTDSTAQPEEPPATPEPTEVEQPTEQPPTEEAQPTESAEPTAEAETGLLPRSLYFLSGQSGTKQIWRMEPDGETVTQLTNESGEILDFDVSPADGSLAYVVGDDLIRTGPNGENRQVLFTNPVVERDPLVAETVHMPRWHPSGEYLVFGFTGVNRIDAEGGEAQMLIESDPPPQPPDYDRGGRSRFYHPYSWAPDGSYLLVSIGFFPEGGTFGLYNPADGSLTELNHEQGDICCSPTWSASGDSILFASDAFAYVQPGMWLVDVPTGNVETLVSEAMGLPLSAIFLSNAKLTEDGTIYAWKRPSFATDNMDDILMQPQYLHRVQASKVGNPDAWEEIAPDPLRPVESLWAMDASGIVVATQDPPNWYEVGSDLFWIPTDGSDLQPLPIRGITLRWGP